MKKQAKKGKFIVFEGIDGSGKSTQTKLLVNRLKKEGYKTKSLDFPQYREKSAGLVEEYLAGKYGLASDVDPYTASVFYAVDRYDVSFKLRMWLENGNIVVADRYVGSNMGHQGGKIESETERMKFFLWLHDLEYRIFNIPKADKTFLLKISATVAQKLCENPIRRKTKKRDIHEKDLTHLKDTEKAYSHMVRIFPHDFTQIEIVDDNDLLLPEEIHQQIWRKVQRLL